MDINELLEKYGIPHPRCGADCGDGWVPLVEELIVKLIDLGWDKEVAQIKEKFGGLRFYIDGTQKMYDLISEYEGKSYKICERCGKAGKLRNNQGWWLTLCDECDKVKP